MLRRESEKKARSGKSGGSRAKAAAIDLPAELQPVFEALRARAAKWPRATACRPT